MKTGYFAAHGKMKYAVSISLFVPSWWMGRFYSDLAPTFKILNRWNSSSKIKSDEENYIKSYQRDVLARLDPIKVYEQLGPDAILLCYEAPFDSVGNPIFCHRHIVAKWLQDNCKIEVKEMENAKCKSSNRLF